MYRFLLPAAALLLFPACDSGEPDEDDAGPQELITEVTLTLTPTTGGAAVVISALDSDGDGRDVVYSPSVVALTPGVSYNGAITLRDGVNDEDITEEIRDEAEEHLFRYGFDPAIATVGLTDTESDYGDQDTNGGDFGVGLRFLVIAGDAASGDADLNAILYHFDDAPKTSSTATSDEIDVDLAFPVTFEAPTL